MNELVIPDSIIRYTRVMLYTAIISALIVPFLFFFESEEIENAKIWQPQSPDNQHKSTANLFIYHLNN